MMRLRDKILYMSYGAGLVVLGMVLNSLIDDADAKPVPYADGLPQVGAQDVMFRDIVCRNLIVKDGSKKRGTFGLGEDNDARLVIYGDDGKSRIAYLGGNGGKSSEMMLQLQSKSETDNRGASVRIAEYGGRFVANNKLGENVAFIGTRGNGKGAVAVRDGEAWYSIYESEANRGDFIPRSTEKHPFLVQPKGKYEYK